MASRPVSWMASTILDGAAKEELVSAPLVGVA